MKQSRFHLFLTMLAFTLVACPGFGQQSETLGKPAELTLSRYVPPSEHYVRLQIEFGTALELARESFQ
ncbi:MAG: hypothetical protein IH991_00365 [Planctomycetes bacterium]|nr:hypothetical protein [Planctomycetota bacterium]